MARRNGQRESTGVMMALIYTRVSKDEQAKDGLSLPAQLQACRRYCAERGWLIAGEYEDVLTGTRDDRPRYQELLMEARRFSADGKDVAVVVARLDRFGRRLVERIRSREEFKVLGVGTHRVREGGEVSDLMANMLAVMAQEEVERLGDRIRDTRQHNVVNGWHTPGRPAWGYRLRESTPGERAAGAPKSVLTIDETTAPYVAEAFRRVASGEQTPRAVALWVAGLPDEARGFVSATVRVAGSTERQVVLRPRIMYYSAIRLMFESPVYVARFADGSPGRWAPLIDEATWEGVRRRLSASSGRSGPVSGNHLLSGLLRCPRCGSKMGGWTQAGRWKRYRCNSFTEGGEKAVRDCKETAAALGLDAAVLRQVSDLLAPLASDNAAFRASIARAWDRLRRPNDAAARERHRMIARARKDAQDARRRLADAARLLVDGTIDRTAYAALAAEEQKRLESAERLLEAPVIESANASLPPLADVLSEIGGWQAALMGQSTPDLRHVLALVVESVVPVRISHGKFRADITWAPIGRALMALSC